MSIVIWMSNEDTLKMNLKPTRVQSSPEAGSVEIPLIESESKIYMDLSSQCSVELELVLLPNVEKAVGA